MQASHSHEHRRGYLHMFTHRNSGNILVVLYELATALSSLCLQIQRIGSHTDAYPHCSACYQTSLRSHTVLRDKGQSEEAHRVQVQQASGGLLGSSGGPCLAPSVACRSIQAFSSPATITCMWISVFTLGGAKLAPWVRWARNSHFHWVCVCVGGGQGRACILGEENSKHCWPPQPHFPSALSFHHNPICPWSPSS